MFNHSDTLHLSRCLAQNPENAATVLPAYQVLSADWCKYNDCMIATGSVDKSVKIWDVRVPGRELRTLVGHKYVRMLTAVRGVHMDAC